MRIGEVAQELGINPKTIRYYEQIDLLPEPDRDTSSGYRSYGPEDVSRLRFVKRAQQLDLRLDEIREILALREGGEPPCAYVREVAQQRIEELDARIAEMLAARHELATLLQTAGDVHHDDAEICPLIERHAAASDERTPVAVDA